MKWILIIISMFCIGATIDWDLGVGDNNYIVVNETGTITFRPPTILELKTKEFNELVNIKIKQKVETGQNWYNNQRRKYAYNLSDQIKMNIKLEVLDTTTYFDEIREEIEGKILSESGFIKILLSIILAILGAGFFVIKKILRKRNG